MTTSRRSSPVRLIIVLGVIILAGAAGAFLWQRDVAARAAAQQGAIRQETVALGSILSTVSATGNLAPEEQVNLYFAASSLQPVLELDIVLGQAVTEGQVLARLDDRALELAVRDAELALEAAELDLAQLTAAARPEAIALAEANLRVANSQLYAASLGTTPQDVEIARLNLVLAQNALNSTYAAMERLVEQGRWAEKNALQPQADRQVEEARIADLQYQAAQRAGPQGQRAAAQAAVEQAEADLARLQRGPSPEDVRIAELRISQSEAALELARHSLEGAQLAAPFDGVVAAINLRVGEPPPGAALPAVVLAKTNQYYLDVSVDEVDVALVAPGQAVTVTVDALPELLLPASVQRISPSASVNAGVVSYPVRLMLSTVEAGLRGGMTATAAIVVDEAANAVRVPNWAIRRDRDTGAAFVSLLRAGVLVEVPVELGLRDETHSQVLGGVSAGDVVAVDTTREQFSILGGS